MVKIDSTSIFKVRSSFVAVQRAFEKVITVIFRAVRDIFLFFFAKDPKDHRREVKSDWLIHRDPSNFKTSSFNQDLPGQKPFIKGEGHKIGPPTCFLESYDSEQFDKEFYEEIDLEDL